MIRTCLVVALLFVALTACDKRESSPPPLPILSELDQLKQSAESGDVPKQIELAQRYAKGDTVPKAQSEAMRWYLKAAQAGNPPAMHEVSKRFMWGFGTEKNDNEAKAWLLRAAKAGNLDAQYEIATKNAVFVPNVILLLSGPKPTEAEASKLAKELVDGLTVAAKAGHPQSMHSLAWVKMIGVNDIVYSESGAGSWKQVVVPDANLAEALELLQVAAEKGLWEAQRTLAVLYQSGFKDIKADQQTSNKWWQRLETQTDADSQYAIGARYAAADKSKYDSGSNRWKGRQLSFEDTNAVAAEWYAKSAAQGNAGAMWNLALLQFGGRGVYKDNAAAIGNLRRAAERGHPDAMYWLGARYTNGEDVPKDYSTALDWYSKAVNAEEEYGYNGIRAQAQNAIGVFYEYGYGITKDLLLAYAWYNLAASGGYEKAKTNLSRVEKELKPEELTEAQSLTRQWSPGKTIAREGSVTISASGGKSQSGLKQHATGTGFFVSSSGDILTNQHVVNQCTEVRIPALSKAATLRVADAANDLAIVRVEPATDTGAILANADTLKQGEEIAVFGFPLDGFLPASGNFTLGIVSALAGPNNNSSMIQITAPVQPGNSGGPVLDKRGRVVGVVVGKANAIKIAQVTGDITQNVNFAIGGRTVMAFLDGNQIEYKKPGFALFSDSKSSAEIADMARRISVKVECWR